MLIRSSFECVIQTHVSVQRVIARTNLFFGQGVVEWHTDLRLVGEELTEFQTGRHTVFLLGVRRALHDPILQSAEAVTDIAARQVERTKVGKLDIHRTRGSPSPIIVAVHQTELIDPHLTRLHLTGDVPDTDHHHLHVAERRVTKDADLVVRTLGIIVREELVE